MEVAVLVDTSKSNVFVWVPGTGGHEVHPAFMKALETVLKDNYQTICVKYPAAWDFSASVPVGEKALKKVLRAVSKELAPGQRVFVGGSSQGAWVISNVYNNTPYVKTFGAEKQEVDYKSIATKTVMFGHPGVSEAHDHQYDEDDTILEVNDAKNDAVTYGWGKDTVKMVRAITSVLHGKVWHLPYLLWVMARHPKKFFQMLYLIACHVGIIRWNTSPHDYSRQMPLAVYWLVH